MNYDKDYACGDFAVRLLIDAFTDLLRIINTARQPELKEELVETGLLRQDSDSDHFDDAKEYYD